MENEMVMENTNVMGNEVVSTNEVIASNASSVMLYDAKQMRNRAIIAGLAGVATGALAVVGTIKVVQMVANKKAKDVIQACEKPGTDGVVVEPAQNGAQVVDQPQG